MTFMLTIKASEIPVCFKSNCVTILSSEHDEDWINIFIFEKTTIGQLNSLLCDLKEIGVEYNVRIGMFLTTYN